MPLSQKYSIPWRLALGLVLSAASARAEEKALFESGEKQAALIELYTAEGCSSCPAADSWLSTLKSEPRLWKELVPIAFHVDYWDRSGWKDRFANSAFTQRQRAYVASWGTGAAYTPAFAVNGREWKGNTGLPAGSGARAGVLKVSRAGGTRLAFSFTPVNGRNGPWDLHLALLGSGLASKVNGGENAGRLLQHDFVALKYERMRMNEAEGRAQVEASQPSSAGAASRLALAAWVTQRDQLAPVQATGGWLP